MKIRSSMLRCLLLLPLGLAASVLSLAAPQPPSDVEISWGILEHQILGSLPSTFSTETSLGKVSLQRRTGRNYSQALRIGVKAPQFVLQEASQQEPEKKAAGKKDEPAPRAAPSPAAASTSSPMPAPSGAPLPRQGGSDFKLTSKPPSGVVASLRPGQLSVEQEGSTHVKIPHLKVDTKDVEIEFENVELDISGIALKLDNAVELRADASITEKDGIPKLTNLDPSILIDPSKISVDCDKLELNLPIQFAEMSSTEETNRIIREQACQFLNKNVSKLWEKHSSTVNKALEALEAPLVETANQQLEKMVRKQLEDAVRLSIHGLEVTQNSLYVGVAASGRSCGTLARPGGVADNEMAVRLGTSDINSALARMPIKSFDLGDGLGSVTLNRPPVLISGPGVEEGTYDIEFDGTLIPASGSKLPVLPGSQPPYSAKGRIRVKPTGRAGEVKLELMRNADFTISDKRGNNVQVRQDARGGTISTPKTTVDRLVDGAINSYSGPTTSMIYDGKRLRRDLKVLHTTSGNFVVSASNPDEYLGRINTSSDGRTTVESWVRGVNTRGLQLVQTREIDFQGTRATLIGRPTTRGSDGSVIAADMLVDITAANLKKVKPDLGDLETLGEYNWRGKRKGEVKEPVNLLTIRVGADLKLDAKGDKLAVGIDKVRDFDITNLDPSITVGFKGWVGRTVERLTPYNLVTDGVKGAIQDAKKSIAQTPMTEVKKADVPAWKSLEQTIGDGVNVSRFNFGAERFEMTYQFTSPQQTRLVEVARIQESELIPDAYQGWAHLKSARVRNGRLELRLTEGSGASSPARPPH